jgi:hypothetical protein
MASDWCSRTSRITGTSVRVASFNLVKSPPEQGICTTIFGTYLP